MYINVLIETKVSKNDMTFTYHVPDDLGHDLIGKRVLVPFNNRTIEGFVISTSTKRPDYEVKDIINVIDSDAVLDDELLTGEKIELFASGRTDSGVHSLGQTANFKTNSNIEIGKMAIAINSKLKKSIVIKSAEEVDENFHARYCCKGKKYRYIINNSYQGTAIYRDLECHIPQKLDVEKMRKSSKIF